MGITRPRCRRAVRALGITAAKRLAIAETLLGFNADTWNGIMAPRETPREIIGRIQSVIAQALQQPEVREKLYAQGGEPVGTTAGQFAAFLKSENAKWGKVIKDSGAKPE